MPKYRGKQIFAHGRFPEVGQKQKTEEKKKERKRERLNNGENNGQATHGARKNAWRTQAAWANFCNFAMRTACVLVPFLMPEYNKRMTNQKQTQTGCIRHTP